MATVPIVVAAVGDEPLATAGNPRSWPSDTGSEQLVLNANRKAGEVDPKLEFEKSEKKMWAPLESTFAGGFANQLKRCEVN